MEVKESELAKREVLRLNNTESNRLTKECLSMALIYLMAEKPFDKITITELVKRSGVSRTAFYRNYNTKEDILKDIYGGVMNVIRGMLDKPEYRSDIRSWYEQCFNIVRENAETIALMLRAHLSVDNLFEKGSLVENIMPSDSYEVKYRNVAAEAAFTRILETWFEDGMQQSSEEMANLCDRIFANTRLGVVHS